jgi:hypothetical protein
MTKIVPSHPHLVAEHQDVIMSSVNAQDMSIRMRALDLVSAMVSFLRPVIAGVSLRPTRLTRTTCNRSFNNCFLTSRNRTSSLYLRQQTPSVKALIHQ